MGAGVGAGEGARSKEKGVGSRASGGGSREKGEGPRKDFIGDRQLTRQRQGWEGVGGRTGYPIRCQATTQCSTVGPRVWVGGGPGGGRSRNRRPGACFTTTLAELSNPPLP